MSNSLFQWIKKNSVLLWNTGSLVGTMLVTSGLGFAYWWVAARFFPTEAVGLASSATSIMMVISMLFVLGQGTLLITELARNKGQEGNLISASLILVGSSSFIGSFIFALLVPFVFPALRFLGTDMPTALLFALGVCLTTVTFVLDQAAIGLLQGSLQLWRNTLFSIVKLALLVVVGDYLAQKSGISVYTTWTLGNLISLIPVLLFLIAKKKWSLRYYIPNWDMMKNFGWASLQHHTLNLIVSAPTQLLSPMVTILVSSQANGWFYIALMMSNFVFSLSSSLTTVLHATNAAKATTLTQKTRMTVGLAMLANLLAGGVLYVGAGPILHFFGSAYANHATALLRILIFAAIPLTIKNHYLSICRIKDQVQQAIIPVTVGAICELGFAAFGAHMWGLSGLSLGWVIALGVEALIMAPVVWTTIMGSSALERYLDKIAASETMLLPALDQFQPSGAIQITSTGLASVLTEMDTVRISAVRIREARARSQASLPAVKSGTGTGSVNKDFLSSSELSYSHETDSTLQPRYRTEKPKAARNQFMGAGSANPPVQGVSVPPPQHVERSNTVRPSSAGDDMRQVSHGLGGDEGPKADRVYRASVSAQPTHWSDVDQATHEQAIAENHGSALDYNGVEQLDFSGQSLLPAQHNEPQEKPIAEQETIQMPISEKMVRWRDAQRKSSSRG